MKKALYLCLLLVSISSCKKEQPHMATLNEGCDCAHEVSADFLMEEMSTSNLNFAKYTSTDSIFIQKNVQFRALEDDAEYTWIIGAETLTTQSVTRYFDFILLNQIIPVTLIVKKEPNKICNPNDDGIDTITKNLFVVGQQSDDDQLLIGTYRMKSPLLNDSIDITIDIHLNDGGVKALYIYNYDGNNNNCDNGFIDNFNWNFRQIWFETSDVNCDAIRGDIHYRLDGIIEMNFSTGTTISNNVKNYLFRGRKLN